jgi:hypothetical protein
LKADLLELARINTEFLARETGNTEVSFPELAKIIRGVVCGGRNEHC